MGIEQGTPVVGSSIELPHNIDLPDLRLPRAFSAWTEFKTNHQSQIAAIGTLSLDQVIALGEELSVSVSQAIGMEIAIDRPRGIDKGKMVTLSEYVSGGGNRIVFMRHGEQSPPEWVYSIPDPALRKIRMMQNPFNRDDCLTNKGFVDVFATAFSLFYLQELTSRQLHVLSSQNARAKEVAGVISHVIPSSTFSTEGGLDSVSYKDENDHPPVTLEQLLEDLPTGTIPWNPELVDRLCKRTSSGLSQSEVIIKTIADLMKKGTAEKGSDLMIVLTHTQQLAEVLRVAGHLEDPFIRFPELSMIILKQRHDLIILPKGVISEKVDKA